MSTVPIPALFRDYEDFQKLKRRDPQDDLKRTDNKRSKLQHLEEFARKTRAYADVVRRDWSHLPDDRRNALRAFAYREGPRGGFTAKLLFYARGFGWLALIVLRRQFFAVHALAEAFGELREAVLNAIERENPAYQERARAAVIHAVRPSDARPAETSEEFKHWLAELSDKADRRV